MKKKVTIIMNVIFLDIDGVLNSKYWNENHEKDIKNIAKTQEDFI